MTYEVKLSQLPQGRDPLDAAVQEYISKMHAFSKTVGQPRPVTHPVIEACVRRVQQPGQPDTYVADYTVVDDTPPPPAPLSFGDRKSLLRASLGQAENEAKQKVLPAGKIRLLTLKMQMAASKPEADRSAEENEDLSTYISFQKAYQQIELIAAQAEADIEDLSSEALDKWELPKFG